MSYRYSNGQADFMTTDANAQRLADKLADYWRAKGVPTPVFQIERGAYVQRANFFPRYVRSDMVNGLPRGCVFKGGRIVFVGQQTLAPPLAPLAQTIPAGWINCPVCDGLSPECTRCDGAGRIAERFARKREIRAFRLRRKAA